MVAPIVIVVAYTVFGLSGFGSTIISVPILAHFLPISYLVPLMALLDCASAAFVGTSGRRHLSKPELKRLMPFMFIGFVAGVTLLVGVPDDYLRMALGLFAMVIGVYSILNPSLVRTISAWWCVPAGVIGGAIATVFGAGGPIYVTYLSGRLRDKGEVRATLTTLIAISAFTRAAMYAVAGLVLKTVILAGVAVLAPFVWIGLQVGLRIHVGLTHEQMRRAVGSCTTAASTKPSRRQPRPALQVAALRSTTPRSKRRPADGYPRRRLSKASNPNRLNRSRLRPTRALASSAAGAGLAASRRPARRRTARRLRAALRICSRSWFAAMP